jgi:hypothetical protein
MTRAQQNNIAKALLDRHGRTFAHELRVNAKANTPAPLFALLLQALLASARISADIAFRTTCVLLDRGWTTPKKLADTTWQQRVEALGEGGYVRYDESTARMLGETAALLTDRYRGDLRNLRKEAKRDPEEERKLLKELKGIGETGADIFFREVQLAWPELYPFVDKKAQAGARKLGLPPDADGLRRLTNSRGELVRLVAALVRVQLAGKPDEIKALRAEARAA